MRVYISGRITGMPRDEARSMFAAAAEIAARMHLSTSTVKEYLNRARTKLKARNRTHLVAQAFRAGLLEVPRG